MADDNHDLIVKFGVQNAHQFVSSFGDAAKALQHLGIVSEQTAAKMNANAKAGAKFASSVSAGVSGLRSMTSSFGALGGAIGSFFTPVGTIIGAAIGMAIDQCVNLAKVVGGFLYDAFKVFADFAMGIFKRLAEAAAVTGLAIGAAFAAAALKGRKLNEDMEQLRLTFVATQGTAKGLETLAWLQKFADVTPQTTEAIMKAGRMLAAYGLDVQSVLPSLENLNAAFGMTEEGLDQLAMAAGRMGAGGGGMAMRILRQFGISGRDFEKQGLKVSGMGMIGGSVVEQIDALKAIIKEKYGDLGALQAETGMGLASTITSYARRMLRGMTGSFTESVKGVQKELRGAVQGAMAAGTWDTMLGNLAKPFTIVGNVIGVVAHALIGLGKVVAQVLAGPGWAKAMKGMEGIGNAFLQVFTRLTDMAGKAMPGIANMMDDAFLAVADTILRVAGGIVAVMDYLATEPAQKLIAVVKGELADTWSGFINGVLTGWDLLTVGFNSFIAVVEVGLALLIAGLTLVSGAIALVVAPLSLMAGALSVAARAMGDVQTANILATVAAVPLDMTKGLFKAQKWLAEDAGSRYAGALNPAGRKPFDMQTFLTDLIGPAAGQLFGGAKSAFDKGFASSGLGKGQDFALGKVAPEMKMPDIPNKKGIMEEDDIGKSIGDQITNQIIGGGEIAARGIGRWRLSTAGGRPIQPKVIIEFRGGENLTEAVKRGMKDAAQQLWEQLVRQHEQYGGA